MQEYLFESYLTMKRDPGTCIKFVSFFVSVVCVVRACGAVVVLRMFRAVFALRGVRCMCVPGCWCIALLCVACVVCAVCAR